MKIKVYWRFLLIAISIVVGCFIFHVAFAEYVNQAFISMYTLVVFPACIVAHILKTFKKRQRVYMSNFIFCLCCLLFAICFTFVISIGHGYGVLVGLLLIADIFVFSVGAFIFLLLGKPLSYIGKKDGNKDE